MLLGTPQIKLGLFVVIIFQIISLFYFLHVYNEFVSNQKNYVPVIIDLPNDK